MIKKLEDCKAEIFRRSERRIIKREKSRKKILGTATLMLFFILAVLPFSLMLMDMEDSMDIKLSEDKGEEIYTLYSQSHITDEERLNDLCEFIDKYTDSDQNKYYGQSDGSVDTQIGGDSKDNKNDYQGEYEVMFTYYINGSAHCYVINESFLINTKTHQITELSEDEKKELLSLLGIQKEE